jgi:hypothetical protein
LSEPFIVGVTFTFLSARVKASLRVGGEHRDASAVGRTTDRKEPQMHASRKLALTAALAIGAVAGSYGVASAASGSGSGSSSIASIAAQVSPPSAQQPWGGQRSDETPLTGDTKSKVEAAAKAKLPGATIVRTETDADGNAAYEVHMTQADGTPATVYVDKQFDVVSVQTGMSGGPQHQRPQATA